MFQYLVGSHEGSELVVSGLQSHTVAVHLPQNLLMFGRSGVFFLQIEWQGKSADVQL